MGEPSSWVRPDGLQVVKPPNMNFRIGVRPKITDRIKSQGDEPIQGDDFDNKEHCMYVIGKEALDEGFEFKIRSFLAHMRSLLITDGAHLKGTYKGTNLVLDRMDGNNQIVPIAICEVPNLAFITDRHLAIIRACNTIFPNAFHGYCCRHLMMNCKMKSDKLQAIYWKACKAYTPGEFQRRVFDLRGFRPKAYKKLEKAGFETWSRAMCLADSYSYMTSNIAESINNPTRHVRKAAITQLMEWKTTLYSTYQDLVYPVGEPSSWVRPDGLQVVKPPKMNFCTVGRPKNIDRIKSQGEEPIQVRCSRCGVRGHNRTTCHEPIANYQDLTQPRLKRSRETRQEYNIHVDLGGHSQEYEAAYTNNYMRSQEYEAAYTNNYVRLHEYKAAYNNMDGGSQGYRSTYNNMNGSSQGDNASKTDDRIDKLADQILNLVEIVNKQVITPASAKAVEKTCVICGGAHAYYDCIATDSNQPSVCEANGSYNQINVLRGNFNKQEENLRRNLNNDMRSILGSFFQNQASTSGTLSSNIVPNPKGEMKAVTTCSGLAYEGPLILANSPLEKVVEHDTKEIPDKKHSNYQGSTAQVQPLVVPIFIPEPDSLLTNKDKLFELAKVPLNDNCSAMLFKKLPEKLGDPKLTPTRMTLELADRSITRPKEVAEDVFVKVGKFHFPPDFVFVDFEADPRVPLILGRSFLRTDHALIDVYGEGITLRVNDESVTFNLNQTMRYSLTYDDNSVNRVDVIDIACKEFVQDVLDFQYNPKSSNPTLVSDPLFSNKIKINSCKVPIVKSSSPKLTPFGESDFFLEEIEDFLKDESIPVGIKNSFYDPEGDILYLEKLLNEDPFKLPSMDLKQAEETKAKSSIEDPPELELKELPSHIEYAFLEESNKFPVIISKDLKDVEKEALIKILKSHKWAIAWKISDINGHKISKSGIEVDRARVDVIAKLPHPTTVKGVRSFLGHAGFYRCFIQDFSKIARPMTHLLEKETPFVFSKDCIDVFNTLKKKLTEAPILVVPDWNLYFELMCDASDFVIGAVLGQRKMKHFQPIHYASKTMTEAQIHYTTTEKEMLAVVYADCRKPIYI
uniref:Reverse transcriptase domain-containing protein n=1 Tax=Tanacetum cinerariifolium TaxID=118510 RepID=A0A6L2L7Q6_TANCI|nr:reverse transcriptase domain-containing protein [Tanacetum cinerariifolium]